MSSGEASEFEFVAFRPNETSSESKEKKRLVKSKAMRTRYLNRKNARADPGNSRKVLPLLPKDHETPSPPPTLDAFAEDPESSEQAKSKKIELALRHLLPTPGRMSGDRMDVFDTLPAKGDIRVDNIIRFCTHFLAAPHPPSR